MKIFQFIVWTVIIAGGTAPAYAQANPLVRGAQTVAKKAPRHIPWTKAVRLGGQSYVVPQAQVGQAILGGMQRSFIGTASHVHFNKVVATFNPLGTSLSRYVAQAVVKPVVLPPVSFAGYYANFPHAWEQFTNRTRSTGGRLEVLLEAAYGEKPQFSGRFVATFNEVMYLANLPVTQGVSAQEALSQAFAEAQTVKGGFFVIRVMGNMRRPQDTLLLDLNDLKYISYNQSQAQAWKEALQTVQKNMELEAAAEPQFLTWKDDPTVQDRRLTQGIILKTDGLKYPREIAVSHTGNAWAFYHLNAAEANSAKEAEQALNLWTAWNKGYYIMEGNLQTPWLFASGKGKPLFATPREVDVYIKQQKALTRPGIQNILLWQETAQ